ncbi:LamG domain-containing protein [Kribbella sp. NPDC056861]|uniref:LamG domain-containing protein n=1 Tax=Kribbella sp. NPDC056861 TaxID=3154857 RepID=UPI00342B9F0D
MRNRAAKRIAGLISLAMLAAVLPMASIVEPADAVTLPPLRAVAGAPDAQAAQSAARRQGSKVEVTNLRTEKQTVFAAPDGTMNLELSPTPVRVKQGSSWVGVETDLVRRTDGSVGPAAASVELSFSGGGKTTPLVAFGKDGKRLALSWPGELPEPKLVGPTATYPEVRPGVDLVMTATAAGYTQHLVVKNAAAAVALTRVELGMQTTGMTIAATRTGALEAKDSKGQVAFTAPPSAMWDSGALTSVAAVEVTAKKLTLVPDQKLMRDPKARFPITVDPNWNTWDKNFWTSVVSGNPDRAYPNTSPGGSDVAQVGKCDWSNCGIVGTARSYFQFDTGAGGILQGKAIMGAWLDTAVVHSGNCTDSWHTLHVSARVDGNTKWSNMPTGGEIAGANAPRANTNGNCGGWKPFSFGLPTNQINAGGTSTYYLQAGNEGDSSFWRKYDPAATKLRVRFNGAPNTPGNVRTDPPLAAACKWCNGTQYFSGTSIRLLAGLSDPDGNSVLPQWDIYTNGAVENRYGGLQGNGATHDTTVALTEGKTMEWYVRGWDTDENNGNRLASGPWVKGPGPFVVDRTAPSSAPKVSAVLYRQDNRWHGGVGVPDTLTFERTTLSPPDAGTADVDHYLWGTSNPPTKWADATGALGGPATVTFAPETDGPQDIFVQSVDRAGNKSPIQTHHIYVRAGNGALSQYPLDGNTTDEAFLGDRDGALAGGPTYGTGAIGSALRLDGLDDSFSAPGAVRTDTSFSVSAWVKPEALPDSQVAAIATQEGDRVGAFYLNYRGDSRKLTFQLTNSDQDEPNSQWVQGPAIPIGAWSHVTGVHDQQSNKLRLYLNGAKVGETALPAAFTHWAAAGPLSVGRDKWNGNFGDWFKGSIDEVQVFDRALTDADVRAAVGRDNVRTGQWKLDDQPGTTARNDVDGGSDLVLYGNAALSGPAGGGALGGALQLSGSVSSYAATSGPVLRTDQSYTIGSWVKATQAPPEGQAVTAVSADSTTNSAFFVNYRTVGGKGRWEYLVPSADTGTPRAADAQILSTVEAKLDVWTHLAAVYDAPAHQIKLYVDGKLAGTIAQNAGFNAAGPLTIGRGRWGGTLNGPWKGSIDDLRAYNRELSEAELQGIVARSNVTAGSWKLDGTANDSSGRGLNGTLSDGVLWTGGQSANPAPGDLALKLNGTSTHLSAPAALDLRQSFSATAWVRLDSDAHSAAVVSQDAGRISAFNLHLARDKKWVMAMRSCDANWVCLESRATGPEAQLGAWTHLAAVYDASAGQLAIYVNGVLTGSQAYKHTWDYAAGPLRIGRATWVDGSMVDFFPGAIDDVNVYSRVLFADEIRAMAGRDLTLAHNWRLDEPSGATAADSVGARGGALTGATHVVGKLGNALDLDGVDDTVTTTGVDVDTAKSFTVSSWVKLRRICDPGEEFQCRFTAVSLDGGATSKFRLGLVRDIDNHPFGAWTFEMPEADGTVTKASVSAEESDLGSWVQLVGVYDAKAQQIWLYVNATRQSDGTLNTPWKATGGLQLGRGRVDGAAAEYWPGQLDDVRVYTGALDKSRIETLFASYPVTGGGTPTMPTDPAAYWKFEEGTGTALADASGKGRTATMRGTATWTGGRSGAGAWFDGITGYADTGTPVLNTAGSFSASAWVYLTQTGQGNRTIVAQDGNRNSAFLLQYNSQANRWAVIVPSADQDNPADRVLLTSPQEVVTGLWTQVAVSYDSGLKQLKLYVNGVLAAAQVGVTPQASTGSTTIGRGKWNGGPVDYFARGIDEVRLFTRALSDGEMGKLHDDAAAVSIGSWRFDDGTPRDWSHRTNPMTTAGTLGYPDSPIGGKALQLDGQSAATGQYWVGAPRDSYSISAWAKLTRGDKVATVVGQDGDKMSGFVLQYRPGLDRWVFGTPDRDAEGAASAYAVSGKPAVLNEWTHLVAVHDYAAHQLRLYVNGALAGTKNDVTVVDSWGGLTIGRAKVNGVPADYFTGLIDEVQTEQGMVPDAEIALRAAYGQPAAGQIGRFVNAAGARYTGSTDEPVRAGYHFERSLGAPVAAGTNTKVLDFGRVYTVKPTNLSTLPLYRCTSGSTTLESQQADCEGLGTQSELLGYTLAYARLARYNNPVAADHHSTTSEVNPGYRSEGQQGWLAKAPGAGAQPLMSCRDGVDNFLSDQADCEGKTAVGAIGNIWPTAPAGLTSAPIYRCSLNGERFVSKVQNCEGLTLERQLGYVLTALPDVAAVFV